MRNAPQRYGYLNSWPPIGDTAQGAFTHVALQQEGHHRGWALRVESLTPLPVHWLCLACLWDMSPPAATHNLCLLPCFPAMIDSNPSEIISSNKLLLSWVVSVKVFDQSNRNIVNILSRKTRYGQEVLGFGESVHIARACYEQLWRRHSLDLTNKKRDSSMNSKTKIRHDWTLYHRASDQKEIVNMNYWS